MSSPRTLEILHDIVESCLGSPVVIDAALATEVLGAGWDKRLSIALQAELEVDITVEEIHSASSLLELCAILESRLVRDPAGRSIVDVYSAVGEFAREEITHDINYHWYAAWQGDLLYKTDSLENVELVLRMEDAFGFSLSDRDAQEMRTIGQTVRYLWRRSCEQSFTLREYSDVECSRAFIFHELRRLLMLRGGVPRIAVRLDARLGDLFPSRHFQVWKEIGRIFGIDMPHSNRLSFVLGTKKRITIKELVLLIDEQRT